MGELLQQTPKQHGARGASGPGRGKRGAKVEPRLVETPILADMGLTKRESSQAQQLAEMPIDVFERIKSGEISRHKAAHVGASAGDVSDRKENGSEKRRREEVMSHVLIPDIFENPIATKRKGRGMAAHNLKLLEQATAVVEQMKPIAVRQVAYQLFVRGFLPSMRESETKKISRLLVYAREHGSVEWSAIVDESRRLERPLSFRNLTEFAATLRCSFRRDFWETQPWSVQVWSEKNTAAGILRPLLDEYGIPFMIVHGFGSATSVHEAAEFSADDPREQVILYVGDHDPSGMFMSEEDIPKRMKRYEGRLTIRRIALVSTDLPNLPPNTDSEEKKDSRRRWYLERYGKEAWEMDALDPNILRDRLEAAIREYIEPEAWRRMKLVEAAEQKTVHAVADALAA